LKKSNSSKWLVSYKIYYDPDDKKCGKYIIETECDKHKKNKCDKHKKCLLCDEELPCKKHVEKKCNKKCIICNKQITWDDSCIKKSPKPCRIECPKPCHIECPKPCRTERPKPCRTECPLIKQKYNVTNLVSNVPGLAPFTDPLAINSWGIVLANNLLYVADNGTDSITVYNTNGSIVSPPITVVATTPTGLVYNSSNNFIMTNGINVAPARFLTATESGKVDGYNPILNPTNTITVINQTGINVYKGLAITDTNLYVTNFNNNRIDTFDTSFVLLPGFPFIDPDLPAGFAPINIVYLNGFLYVTYAKQDPTAHDDVAGPGNGFVNVFTTGGVLVRRLISRGYLNSPWGIILYILHNRCGCEQVLLIGNFGDGTISAYDLEGNFLGKLRDINCTDIIIDGLWGLTNGLTDETIFFASGPNDETNGLIGVISS